MRTLYIDCGMGAAGDMLTASLLELTDHPESVIQQLNAIGIPGVVYQAESVVKNGIRGTRMHVEVLGEEEGEHTHTHADGTTHSHRTLPGIEHIINDHMELKESLKESIRSVYAKLADAESRVHGVPVNEIHFHEVGDMDALADITAVCYLMDLLHPDRVIASPVHVGRGTVKCAHGILPVPAPATALLLEDVPIYSREEINGELCTPTGAALLTTFVSEYGPLPVIRGKSIGYGMGKKEFPILNCVRTILGESEGFEDKVCELNFNVDDMTGEEIGFATSELLKEGAREVYTTAVQMKKNRPGTLMTLICDEEDAERLAGVIFRFTTTLGIRKTHYDRYVMRRHITEVETPYGVIRRKDAEGFGVTKSKYEYEDVVKASQNCGKSIREIREELAKLDAEQK
ncbi:MAG: nickel pincer cofactor biosynthesis protein LarC [Solobacterium sp.]|nr:nickel pincer cofactor biosynthesis protein LarC [Solobacterium sp.]